MAMTAYERTGAWEIQHTALLFLHVVLGFREVAPSFDELMEQARESGCVEPDGRVFIKFGTGKMSKIELLTQEEINRRLRHLEAAPHGRCSGTGVVCNRVLDSNGWCSDCACYPTPSF